MNAPVSGCRTRGVEFKGRSLHDGFGSFDGFGGSGEHLTLLLLAPYAPFACPTQHSTEGPP